MWIYLDYWYCMEIGLLSTDSELAMALVRILYLLNGWNVEEIDSVSAELQWQFLSPGLINLYFLLWESRDYLRPCSDRQPVSVNDSLRFLSRKAILISFSGKRTAANLFQNLFEFGKSLGAMDKKLQLLNLWRSFLRIEITFNTLNLSFAYYGFKKSFQAICAIFCGISLNIVLWHFTPLKLLLWHLLCSLTLYCFFDIELFLWHCIQATR